MRDILADAAGWIWIPITVAACIAQIGRNAVQRSLVKELGTWGATLVRFLYGMPFALAALAIALVWLAPERPALNWTFWIWITVSGVGQILATGFLLSVMAERNFAIGVAYSKTELIQIAAVSLLILGDPISLWGLAAIVIATAGILLLSPPVEGGWLRGLVAGITSRAGLLGLACGASFAFTTTGYRGAILSLAPTSGPLAVLTCLAAATTIQTILLGLWLVSRDPTIAGKLAGLWRQSLPAGALGALASLFWMAALSLASAAQVRTVGLVEVLLGFIVARRFLSEEVRRVEVVGTALICAAVVVMLWLA